MRETVRTVVYAVLIALVVRTFMFEPFNIPSGSMKPTLLVGDYLFVSKLAYGYSRHSFPFSFAPFSGRFLKGEPERGDVAVFKLPSDNKTDYIKRIVGLPGDTIQVKGGILHINGEAVKRERIEDFVEQIPSGREVRIPQFIETLPNGLEHRILEESDSTGFDNTGPFTVPEDHYFAMGDNRDNSQDSRARPVGPIPAENLVGRAEILFFSSNGSAHIWEIWKWPGAIRYGRLLDAIR